MHIVADMSMRAPLNIGDGSRKQSAIVLLLQSYFLQAEAAPERAFVDNFVTDQDSKCYYCTPISKNWLLAGKPSNAVAGVTLRL